MAAIITLTTDSGLADAYVAAMKGVILSTNPAAKRLKLTFITVLNVVFMCMRNAGRSM